jgi:hypothetical protein
MLDDSSSLGREMPATQAICRLNLEHDLTHRPETRASAADLRAAPSLFTLKPLRGDQGMDAVNYTERTGTASNRRAVRFEDAGASRRQAGTMAETDFLSSQALSFLD